MLMIQLHTTMKLLSDLSDQCRLNFIYNLYIYIYIYIYIQVILGNKFIYYTKYLI